MPLLRDVLDALSERYGELQPPRLSAFELVLLENAAYLVDDERREATLLRLRNAIGVKPEAILKHSAHAIAAVIADGGMQPLMRAEKVLEAARIANEIGLEEFKTIAGDPKRAKKLRRRFPSIGEPYADRILLFAGSQPTVAPDSNALRVLTRLGFVREEKNYSAMYRAAVAATATDLATARRAHLLLRKHGQETCKRAKPLCEVCPLREVCAGYQAATAPSPPPRSRPRT